LRQQSFILYQVSITYRYLGSGRLSLLVDNLCVGRYKTDVSSKKGHRGSSRNRHKDNEEANLGYDIFSRLYISSDTHANVCAYVRKSKVPRQRLSAQCRRTTNGMNESV